MIEIYTKKQRRGVEWIDPEGIEKTRQALQAGVQAVVIDLDKCLINYYAGVPALNQLIKNREAKRLDVVVYLLLLLRMRASFSSLKGILPQRWRLSSARFQELSLLFELKIDEDKMTAAVNRGMPALLALVRQSLFELCRQAQAQGAEIILATANSATYAEPLAKQIGIPTVLASRLDRSQGRVTQLLIREAKRDAVLDHLKKRQIPMERCWLIVDLDFTGNDAPLIEAFGNRVSLVVNE